MAKSLGQIHTVNTEFVGTLSQGSKLNIDLPGQLTSQLQRMVRAGTFHKLVGLDVTVRPSGLPNPADGVQLTGRILYYVPTRGRCEAFRGAFKSAAEMMKSQGISMRDNQYYDFRAPLNDDITLNTFENLATLDGVTGLCLNSSVAGASIFGVHNDNVQPIGTATSRPLYSAGFDTILQSGGAATDFVLNDTQPYSGNHQYASLEYEEIPFVASFDPTAANSSSETVAFSFRPDPALYVAILCGQMQVVLDQVNYTGTSPGSCKIEISTMVAGWKSIMGNPDKKPRRSKKRMSKNKE